MAYSWAERERLVTVATQDGVVNPDEKGVLANLLRRVTVADLSPTMQVRAAVLKRRYAL